MHRQIDTLHCRWNLIVKRLRETFLLHSSMDTIVLDSITVNIYLASSVLLCKKHRQLAMQKVKDLVGPACEYNDDVLAPLRCWRSARLRGQGQASQAIPSQLYCSLGQGPASHKAVLMIDGLPHPGQRCSAREHEALCASCISSYCIFCMQSYHYDKLGALGHKTTLPEIYFVIYKYV